jgi:hypothetical protein
MSGYLLSTLFGNGAGMGFYDDQGAGLGIGGGMMVLQGNAQMIADVVQFGGINIPGLPG